MKKVPYRICKTRPAGLCADILPLQGELEGVYDNDHFEHS